MSIFTSFTVSTRNCRLVVASSRISIGFRGVCPKTLALRWPSCRYWRSARPPPASRFRPVVMALRLSLSQLHLILPLTTRAVRVRLQSAFYRFCHSRRFVHSHHAITEANTCGLPSPQPCCRRLYSSHTPLDAIVCRQNTLSNPRLRPVRIMIRNNGC